MNTQKAPRPDELFELVNELQYKPGWTFKLIEDFDRGQDSVGLTLVIKVVGPDSYNPDQLLGVNHYMIVPPAAYNRKSWSRWLLNQCLDVEIHEACEFFMVGGQRVYAPLHGPGNNPYVIRELSTQEEVETNFLGVRRGDVG